MVLIVEDDITSGKALSTLIHKRGYSPVIAQSAEEALRLLESQPSLELVVMDIDLPGMSGLDLLRKIKSQGLTVPCVLMSANVHDVAAAKVPFFPKPLKTTELFAFLGTIPAPQFS